MTRVATAAFRLHEFEVRPDLNQIQNGDETTDLELKTMAVLVALAERAGEVVSADELIDDVWDGRPMGDNPVYKCINKLRKAFGDHAQAPRFIATVPKKGYRLLVSPEAIDDPEEARPASGRKRWYAAVGAGVVVTAVLLLQLFSVGNGSDAEFTAGPEPLPKPSSVAVIEFSGMEGDEGADDVAASVADEIRVQLSRIQGLSVVSRNASRAVLESDASPTPQEIRSALNVAYALEGTVRVVNGRLHYTAQLIDTGTGYDIWANSDTRDFNDILDIQTEIAGAVVDALRVKLSRDLATPQRSTNSVEAYAAFRLGQSYLTRPLKPEFLQPAEEHFKQALEFDPNYARAHAGMCQVLRRWYRYSRNVIYLDQAIEACKRAAEIDPELSEVPLALGHLYRDLGRYEDAIEFYERAIAKNPTEMESYHGMALAYGKLGQPDKAKELFETAIDLFSEDSAGYARYAMFLYRRGDYKNALTNYQKAYDLGRTSTTTLNAIAASYYLLGDFEMAARTWQESLQKRESASAVSSLGTAYFYLGRFDDAVEQYRRAIELSPTDYTAWTSLAIGLRQLPDAAEEVRDVCARALELGDERLALNPDDAVTLSYIAPCRVRLGQRRNAREAIDRAVELAPDNTIVLFNAITSLIDLGDTDAAIDLAETIKSLGFPPTLLCSSPELRELPKVVCAEDPAASAGIE